MFQLCLVFVVHDCMALVHVGFEEIAVAQGVWNFCIHEWFVEVMWWQIININHCWRMWHEWQFWLQLSTFASSLLLHHGI